MVQYKISVIIPVYNVETLLSECVNSVLSQSLRDFELILVNDGSTDRSGDICDSYLLIDSRIRVFHKVNGGVSSARNLGLDNSRGEYICFIDSDDWVFPDYLLELYNDACRVGKLNLVFHNYEIAVPGYTYSEYQGDMCVCVSEGQNMINYFIENKLMKLSGPISKLFNKKVIDENKIRFPQNVHMGEDAIFIIYYLCNVDTLIFSRKCNYLVYRRENSLGQTYNNFESEWLGYLLWRDAFVSFLEKYSTSLFDTNQILWENIESAFMRSVQCVFRAHPKISLREQVNCLMKIWPEDWTMMEQFYRPVMLRRKFNKYLLNKRYFTLYCVIGNIFDYFARK
ncbi:glycosyltransferase family 2 protein [Dysgonomonas sp. ZJ709]|uniref:glycosyltransferase family 2 protein n=1 Tax=Dysgonomonas sp. ZJ709 TaxID=2709797 RepID=UPI0013EBE6B8|nr:glycosyltransferase family 2 protein [Dysgonomonas sp. ZJ709]